MLNECFPISFFYYYLIPMREFAFDFLFAQHLCPSSRSRSSTQHSLNTSTTTGPDITDATPQPACWCFSLLCMCVMRSVYFISLQPDIILWILPSCGKHIQNMSIWISSCRWMSLVLGQTVGETGTTTGSRTAIPESSGKLVSMTLTMKPRSSNSLPRLAKSLYSLGNNLHISMCVPMLAQQQMLQRLLTTG